MEKERGDVGAEKEGELWIFGDAGVRQMDR